MISGRNFGLDAMRATAIGLVLASHLANGLEILGVCGVELFFVLSGFLIGGILLKTVDAKGTFEFRDLKEFLRRRWYRTLPNYYLFLLIYFGFQATVISHTAPSATWIAEYAFFLQNLAWPNPNWLFGHSWSLCVEEWFYLLTAFTLLLAMKPFSPFSRGKTWAIGFTLGMFIVGPLALRFAMREQFDDIRMIVMFRLDAISYGVLMALVRSRAPRLWNCPICLFALGTGAISMASALYGRSPTASATALSLMPIGFASMLPACFRARRPDGMIARCVEAISIWSYSMYLCHTLIYSGLKPVFGYSDLSLWEKLGYKITALLLIVTVSAVTYRYFEKPMTDLRDRFGARKHTEVA